MSETPITDAATFYCGDPIYIGEKVVPAGVARELEKNLAAFRSVNEDHRKLLGLSKGESLTAAIQKQLTVKTIAHCSDLNCPNRRYSDQGCKCCWSCAVCGGTGCANQIKLK